MMPRSDTLTVYMRRNYARIGNVVVAAAGALEHDRAPRSGRRNILPTCPPNMPAGGRQATLWRRRVPRGTRDL